MGILQQVTLQVGLGVVKDLYADGARIVDLIPVDYVAKTLLLSVPYMVHQMNTGAKENVMITHCTSSSTKPVNW